MLTYAEYMAETAEERAAGIEAFNEARNASTELAAAIRRGFQTARDYRDSEGISDRYLHCLRAFNGEYSPAQLAEITQFGGSTAFARLTATKCRALTALLEDLYLGAYRPWRVEPSPEPALPNDLSESIRALMAEEIRAVTQAGGQIDPAQVRERAAALHAAATAATKAKAEKDAEAATVKLDDDLVEGGFYRALKDFLSLFSVYPLAILKGPFYQMKRRVHYVQGRPEVVETPLQCYAAPSPFDVWFSPGVHRPEDGDVYERIQLSRSDLEALRAAPNYDGAAIDGVIAVHPDGVSIWTSSIEQARSDQESRESPVLNNSHLYDVIEFHGWVDGTTASIDPLLEKFELDPTRSHHITARMLDGVVIGAHPNPDPLERPIYHVASFEQVPGSVVGRGLPEVLADVQNLANSALRAVINNMSLASGPQVGINTTSIAESENPADMYPWKRWVYTPDPAAPSAAPMMFFQPTDNSQSLMMVFDRAMQYADEVSAIPRYAAGGDRAGGAASTASGLAMLQGNVAKVIKHVAGCIDDRVVSNILSIVYDTRLLTDEDGTFTGDETIRALGVQHAQQQETDKLRAMEMLQITANPVDLEIMGPELRGMLLKEVAGHLGFDNGAISEALGARLAAMAQAQRDPTQQEQANGGNAPPAAPGGTPGVAAPVQGMAQMGARPNAQ